ncbi:GMP/IMP nucleotidase [Aliikangiella sp. IMCC44359]|uniref:GMP/IMP nucleotidase n=1 Tax=Aliikangiella sp. IMCC44359 TaxID=3459125 RepID=UPI00403B33D6
MGQLVNWQSIDTVLLDMDGTILDLAFDNYFWLEFLPQKYAEKNQLSLEESKLFLANSYGAIEGKLQWYCLDFWSERLQLDIAALKYSIKEKVAFRPGAIEFLEFLLEQKKHVYLVTNAHPKSLEIKLLNVSFHQYFKDLSSSHSFGYPKEEQSYWLLLQKKYQFDLKRTLFVDDSVKILKSAEQFGIKHLLGIAQPDMGKGIIDTAPFDSISDFKKIIYND